MTTRKQRKGPKRGQRKAEDVGSRKLSVFFGTSFHPKYFASSEAIRQQFAQQKQLDAPLWQARTPGESLNDATWNRIAASDAVVAVITPGSLRATLEAQLASVQRRHKKRKPLYLFVEKDVPHRYREIYAGLTDNIFYFDSARVEDAIGQVRLVVEELLRHAGNVTCTDASKRVRVLEDGTGYASYYYSYQVSPHPDARMKWITGQLGATRDVLSRNGKREFPTINSLWKEGRSGKKGRPSFTCRILPNPNHRSAHVKDIHETPVVENRHVLRRIFQLNLNRVLNPKDEVSCAWGFAFPKLFKRKGADSSTYRAIYASDVVNIEVAFEVPRKQQDGDVSFMEEPTLTHKDEKGKPKGQPVGAQRRKETLCFSKYGWTIKNVAAGDVLVVNWTR